MSQASGVCQYGDLSARVVIALDFSKKKRAVIQKVTGLCASI
jgi:hypothetical protein